MEAGSKPELLATVALWGVFGLFSLRGVWEASSRASGTRRIAIWLLLSLPVVWTALRVLTQGESRKRSPVDFALAIFAAIGAANVGRGRKAREADD